MNNDCPTENRLVDFALFPLAEENADIVVHMLHCQECARKLRLVNQVITADCDISQEEWTEIRQVMGQNKNQSENLWKKVERLLSPVLFDSPVFFGSREEVLQPAAAAAASLPPAEMMADAPVPFIALTFKADCDHESGLFWTAVMEIVPGSGEEAEQTVLITDGSGLPIAKGRFLLCGQLLTVKNGRTHITLDAFRSGLRNREVAFIFDSGERMDGGLVFALEELK